MATERDLGSPSHIVLLFEVARNLVTVEENLSANIDDGSASGNGVEGVVYVTPDNDNQLADNSPLYATGSMGGRHVNLSVPDVPRHSGGANYVACDGHVRWLRPEQISSGRNQNPGSERCPQDTFGTPCDRVGAGGFAAGSEDESYSLTFSIH